MGTPSTTPPAPRVLLARWLAQLHYNSIRNVETVFAHVTRADGNATRGTSLRGFKIAEDLVITRKRTFYRMTGLTAQPMSIEEVAANYNLDALKASYRAAIDAWKNSKRHVRDRKRA
jgi:hypothetical protein